MKLRNIFISGIVSLLAACSQGNQPDKNATNAATATPLSATELTEKVKNLDMRLNEIEISNIINDHSSVVLDPASSGFLRLDAESGIGTFAVSMADVRQFGDSLKVRVNFGNLLGVDVSGVHLKLRYGKRKKEENYSSWQASLHETEVDLTDDLLAGHWNPVLITLPGIAQADFGYLKIAASTNQIKLIK